MSDDTTPQFDPRFSPAFQRGYPASDLASAPAVPVPGPAVPEVAAQPAVLPAVLPNPAVRDNAAAVQSPPSVLAAPSASAASPSAPAPRAGDPVRNPFLIALGIIAVVFIAAGIGLFVQAGSAFDDPGNIRSSGGYMTLTATMQTAPILALLGAATAIGVLFVFAIRWSGRR